tara:strand:- start:179 stop:568 length:390 start_codon:yes stop_codon:yes gene_type:complete
MKNTILIILSLIPILAFGQSDFYNLNSGDRNLITDTEFQKNPILKTLSDRERKIETTLINDIKKDKSEIDFDLDKSYSFFLGKRIMYKSKLDEKKTNENLFELEPLKELNWKPTKRINSNNLFKNLESF